MIIIGIIIDYEDPCVQDQLVSGTDLLVTTTRGAKDTGRDQWHNGHDQLLTGTKGTKITGPDLVLTTSSVICSVDWTS